MKIKKPSYKNLETQLATSREICDHMRGTIANEQARYRMMEDKYKSQLNDRLLTERRQALESLSRMVESTCRAIDMVVGKEQK